MTKLIMREPGMIWSMESVLTVDSFARGKADQEKYKIKEIELKRNWWKRI